jgi:hypothetical protein
MISAIRSASPPGSTTTASLVSAHATIEQLHCSGPAGNVSTSSTRRPCHSRRRATALHAGFAGWLHLSYRRASRRGCKTCCAAALPPRPRGSHRSCRQPFVDERTSVYLPRRKRALDWCWPRSSKPMMLCESSGMVGSIPMRFRHVDGSAPHRRLAWTSCRPCRSHPRSCTPGPASRSAGRPPRDRCRSGLAHRGPSDSWPLAQPLTANTQDRTACLIVMIDPGFLEVGRESSQSMSQQAPDQRVQLHGRTGLGSVE